MKLSDLLSENEMVEDDFRQYLHTTRILELPGGEPVTIKMLPTGIFNIPMYVTLHLEEPTIRPETVFEIFDTFRKDLEEKTGYLSLGYNTFAQIKELEVYIGGIHFNVLPFLRNANSDQSIDIQTTEEDFVSRFLTNCQPPKLDPSFLTDKVRVEKKGLNLFRALQKGKLGNISYTLEEPYNTSVRTKVDLKGETLYPTFTPVLRCHEPEFSEAMDQSQADKLSWELMRKFRKFDVDLIIETD